MKTHLAFVAVLALLLLCACSRIESDWKAATEANTMEGYSSFLAKHPGSEHDKAAKESLAWLQAKKADSIAGYAKFRKEYPGSAHASEIAVLAEPQVRKALHDLMSGFCTWNDEHKALGEALLAVSPDNPYMLYLKGVQSMLEGNDGDALASFERAKAVAKEEQIDEEGIWCSKVVTVRGPYLGTIAIFAVQPPTGRPTDARYHDSPRAKLSFWIDRYLNQLKHRD